MNLNILKFLMRSERKEIAMIKSEIQAIADGITILQTQRDAALASVAPLNAKVSDLTSQLAVSQAALTSAQAQLTQVQQDDADGLAALHAALGNSSTDPNVEEPPENPSPVIQEAEPGPVAIDPQPEAQSSPEPVPESDPAPMSAADAGLTPIDEDLTPAGAFHASLQAVEQAA